MAKIKYHKLSGQVPKGKEKKSIVGEEYLSNYNERLQMLTEIAHQNHKALIKAEEVILLEKAKQEDDKLDEKLKEDEKSSN